MERVDVKRLTREDGGNTSTISVSKLTSLMMYFVAIFMFFSIYGDVFGRQYGFKYHVNYSRKEYNSDPQNWCLMQDKRGVIFIGNHLGLLQYDGVNWRRINIPNWTVRSIAMDKRGTTYVGGRGEFGFFSPESNGALKYHSLRHHLDKHHKKFNNISRTFASENGIYFQCRKFLARWNDNRMKIWDGKGLFRLSFFCNKTLYIRQHNKGLMQLCGESLKLVTGGELFADKSIYMVEPYDSRRLLIGSGDIGFYIYDGASMTPFPTEADDYLKKTGFCHGIRLSTGDFVLATHRGGIVVMDDEGRIKAIYSHETGLPDDDVKYVYEDIQGNIWLALSSGISKIEYASPFSFYDVRSGLPGIVMAITKHNNHLYAGTTSGIYSMEESGKFIPVPGMNKFCWSLLSINGSLLAATEHGVFRVDNGNTDQLVNDYTFVLASSLSSPQRAWVGTRDGLLSIIIKQHSHRVNYIKKINWQINSIVEDKKGDLWLGTLAENVFRVSFIGDGDTVNPKVIPYSSSDGLPGGEIYVFFIADHVMFASPTHGVFRFSEATSKFVPDLTLGQEFSNGTRGIFRVIEDGNHNIWFHSNKENFHIAPEGKRRFIVTERPFLRLYKSQMNAIFSDPKKETVWMGGHDGLTRLDTQNQIRNNHPLETLIRYVSVNGKKLFFDPDIRGEADIPSEEYIPVFNSNMGTIRFSCSLPFFESEDKTSYRYYLKGSDKNWSEWRYANESVYHDLSPGSYVFYVQGRNVYKDKGTQSVFRFKVSAPWYRTWWAFVIYTFMLFLAAYWVARLRSRKIEKERQQLKQIVKQRTQELEHKNLQLERQTARLKSKSDELKELNQIKSRFFTNISHEFRTPLTLILAPLDKAIKSSTTKEQEGELRVMYRNAQRLLDLINQLLDLSKFDSGKMKLHAVRQNIVPFLKSITDPFRIKALQKKININFLPGKEEIMLCFDPEKMEVIIGNLIVNALKFTPEYGKITISIKEKRVGEEPSDADTLEISICDTGIGIPRKQLSHIFDRFYQAEHQEYTKPDTKGTGIGLALTKELVALHHGRIDVSSAEGKGSEFVIHLPLGDRHLTAEEIIKRPEFISNHQPSRQSPDAILLESESPPQDDVESVIFTSKDDQEKNVILVVEDNSELRGFICETLEPFYRVVGKPNGKAGIEAAKELIPDLIISDIMMPEIDGYELCSTLKEDLATSHIPIILLTAKASTESTIQGLKIHADDYITKPFNTDILIARIRNLIDLRHQLQLKYQRQYKLLPDEMAISTRDELFLKKFQAVLEKNYQDPEFNLEKMCIEIDMPKTSLNRKIRALTGETPNQLLQSHRLERSVQLLKASYGNITEVAFSVGFSSSAYFTKCFREKFHQLPSYFLDYESTDS